MAEEVEEPGEVSPDKVAVEEDLTATRRKAVVLGITTLRKKMISSHRIK